MDFDNNNINKLEHSLEEAISNGFKNSIRELVRQGALNGGSKTGGYYYGYGDSSRSRNYGSSVDGATIIKNFYDQKIDNLTKAINNIQGSIMSQSTKDAYTQRATTMQQDLSNKKENALYRKSLNDYAAASLNGKRDIIGHKKAEWEDDLKSLETVIELQKEANNLDEDAIRLKEESGATLSVNEQEYIDNLNKVIDLKSKIKEADDQELAMIRHQREARYENLSIEEKMQDAQERKRLKKDALKASKSTYDSEVKNANEEFEKNSKEEGADIAALEKERDTAISEAAKRQSERDAGIEAEYGNPEGLGNVGEIVGALGGIGEDIMGIVNIVDMVASGNYIGLIVKLLQGISSLMNKMYSTISEGISTYESLQTSYLAIVNTRLDTGDETRKTFQEFAEKFDGTFGLSKFVNQKSLMERLGELASQGIAYNLEQRTILSELSDRMVSTFDMLDSHLTTLTKLQQADMSVAQLGAESTLTQFLLNTYSDTSYMNTMYDTVTSTIMDALAQYTAEDSVEFNYSVNKWLGALYSLGMSESGVTTLAQGINALATGNIDYFNSNDSARTLFAMASGGSFSDLLVNGVSAENVSDLLNNIVTYLSSISDDTNQVTKNVKAGIFGGLSLSDIRAAGNMTLTDMALTSYSSTTWDESLSQVSDYLLEQAEANTTTAIQTSNLAENLAYTLGKDMVEENSGSYAIYKAGQLLGGEIGESLQEYSELLSVGWTAAESYVSTLLTAFGFSDETLAGDLNNASQITVTTSGNWQYGGGISGVVDKLGDTLSSIGTVFTSAAGLGISKLVQGIGSLFNSDTVSSLGESLESATADYLYNSASSIVDNSSGTYTAGNTYTFTPSSMWNLTTSGLISSRGQQYAATHGIASGLSSSSLIALQTSSGTGLATSVLPTAVSSGSYSNTTDYSTAQSLAEQAQTIRTGAAYSDSSSAITRDMDDLFYYLFERKETIRVILASVEEEAQQNLTISNGRVHTQVVDGQLSTVGSIGSTVSVSGNFY